MDYEKKYKDAMQVEQNAILQELKALHLRMEHQTVCNDAAGNKMWRWAWQLVNEAINIIKEDKDLYEKLKDLHGRVYDVYQPEKQEKTQQESTSDHWHEQDNTMAFSLMRDIEQVSFISKEGKDERISWLNSLEDRFSNQESNKDHWQDVRERAAIAILPQCLKIIQDVLWRGGSLTEDTIVKQTATNAVDYADALVKKLKGE